MWLRPPSPPAPTTGPATCPAALPHPDPPCIPEGSFMLTIFGRPSRNGGFCDGGNRRDFLTIGGAVVGGGLSLPRILAAEASAGTKPSHKAVINIYLPGGPPHI